MNLVPQFGFLELILIAVIALVVVGPKDLPKLMRSAGQFVRKAKALASEFTSAFDQMARESEMEDLRKEIDALKKNNPVAAAERELKETVDPISRDIGMELEELDRLANEKQKSQLKEDPGAPASAAQAPVAAEPGAASAASEPAPDASPARDPESAGAAAGAKR